jgi:hypothetical protein
MMSLQKHVMRLLMLKMTSNRDGSRQEDGQATQ